MARQALGEKASDPVQIQRWKEAHGYQLPYFFNHKESRFNKISQTIFFQKNLPMFWGNFGYSDMTLEPVGKEIRQRIIPSLCLTTPIFFASLLANIFFAMLLAANQGSKKDKFALLLCVSLMSISMLIYIIAGQFLFARYLKLVPVSGFRTDISMWKFLLMPVFIGIISNLGSGIRFYRTLFLEELNKDYVKTARAKGLKEEDVLFVHVLKNALIPVLTNVPVQLLMLIMGNLLLENFFSIPGLGGFTINAVAAQDFAVLRAMVFLGTILYLAGTLLADICYTIVDPRIRLE